MALSGALSGMASFTGGSGSASFCAAAAPRHVSCGKKNSASYWWTQTACSKGRIQSRLWRRKEASQSLTQRLKVYGLAGVVAYGLLNTVYYTAMFTYMWTVGFKVPRGLQHSPSRPVLARLSIVIFGHSIKPKSEGGGMLR